MTQSIIENAQKLMSAKREKVAQEMTEAMSAAAAAAATTSSESSKDKENDNDDDNSSNSNNDSGKLLVKLKARELDSIDQNIKALQELKTGEYISQDQSKLQQQASVMADIMDSAASAANEGAQMLAEEDERAYLIRIGKITPFADKAAVVKQTSSTILSNEEEEEKEKGGDGSGSVEGSSSSSSGNNNNSSDGSNDYDDDDAVCNDGEEFFGDGSWKDDGNAKMYRKRANKWKRGVLHKIKSLEGASLGAGDEDGENDDDDESSLSPGIDGAIFEDSDEDDETPELDSKEFVSEEDFIEDKPGDDP